MVASTAHSQIAASIARTLQEQARRNELRVGWIRFGLVLFLVGTYWLVYLRPGLTAGAGDARQPLIATAWLALCVGVLALLRRRTYPPWLAPVIALADAAAILGNHVFGSAHYGPALHPVFTVAPKSNER